MEFIVVYGLILLLFFVIFFFNGWHRLSSESLYSQNIFRTAIGVPISAFLFFGYFAWSGHTPELSAEGFNRFVSISTLPLGLLSLSIPLVAIITSVHRSLQTHTQIEKANDQIALAVKKNILDEFFLREKNFVDKCAFIEKQVGQFMLTLKDGPSDFGFNIVAPHKLFKNIYQTSPQNGVITYELSVEFTDRIFRCLKAIEDLIKLQREAIRNLPTLNIEKELLQLYIIVYSMCETIDLLTMAVLPTAFFEVEFKGKITVICISSENDLKNLLRKFIILIDALTNAVGYDYPDSWSNPVTREYANLNEHIFTSFSIGKTTNNFIGMTWIDKVRF